MLNFVFPNGIDLKYIHDSPKFSTILTTDLHGNRSYIYILKIYERVNIDDCQYLSNSVCLNNDNFEASSLNSYLSTNFDHKFIKKVNLNTKNDQNVNVANELCDSPKLTEIFSPIAICIWSMHNNTEAFKAILIEIYYITNKNLNCYNGLSDEIINNFRFVELLNYWIFICGIASPPHFSKMKLNLNFSQVEFYNPSKYELPHCDMNIKILFDSLETSIIIKLWCAILTEKQIIFLSHQSYLLYSIIDALLTLIFPFKWIHPCIACINKKNKDFLDAPFPYIMGVLTNFVDLNDLQSHYPNHIICNIDTCQIFCKPINLLPINEEEKIRRKIQFIRNPHIYFIEEIDSVSFEKFRPKDTCSSRSLEKNIQYIFFRVLRGPLENYKIKYLINEKVFDPEKFLNEFDCNDYKFFWNKIIQTIAFEYFIFSDQFIDDSNNIIFENICKLSDDDAYINEKNIYTYTLNIQNYLDNIFKDLETDIKYEFEFKQGIKKLIDHHNFVIKSKLANSKLEESKTIETKENTRYDFCINNNISIQIKHNTQEDLYVEGEKLSLSSNYKVNQIQLSQDENVNSSIRIENISDFTPVLNYGKKNKESLSTLNLQKTHIMPLSFYGKKGILNHLNYIKSRIKCLGHLSETYFLKEVTNFLDKEIKENPHLRELEKFEFGSFNPLIISRFRGESFNNANFKNKNFNELEDMSEDKESINLELKRKNTSRLNISALLSNPDKKNEIEKNIFIELIRCDKPQYYLLLISYFNILRYTKTDITRKSTYDVNSNNPNNITLVKKLNAVRQYVLEIYCKVSKFSKCEYSYLHFYNIVSNLDIEIIMKYICIIPEKFKEVINEKLEKKNKDYNIFFHKHKSHDINFRNKNKEKSDSSENNKNKDLEHKNTNDLEIPNYKKKIQTSENFKSSAIKNDKYELPLNLLNTMINPKSKQKDNFLKKLGTKSFNILFKNKKKKENSPDKTNSIKFKENYLEKLQSNLSKKIKEKKLSKLSFTNYNFSEKQTEEKDELSIEKLKKFNTSNGISKLNLERNENPFKSKLFKNSDVEKSIKEFKLEDENKVETEEELETVFKKNGNVVLDMSINFVSSCDAIKIVEKMKNSKNKMMKIMIINKISPSSQELKNSFGKTEINFINLISEFCEKLKDIIEKYCLNKLSPQMITKDLLKNISNDAKFIELKNRLSLLQPKINEKIVFWINTYNFLSLFTLIFKNEIPSSEYEYKKILANSFYNIGNYVVSLNIIEEVIIKGNYDKTKVNDTFLDYDGCFLNVNTFLNIENKKLNLFALSQPFRSFPSFIIYNLDNYKTLLEENIIIYLKENLRFEIKYNKSVIYISQHLQRIDPNFTENISEYEKYLDPDMFIKINSVTNFCIFSNKTDWEIRFDILKKNAFRLTK